MNFMIFPGGVVEEMTNISLGLERMSSLFMKQKRSLLLIRSL